MDHLEKIAELLPNIPDAPGCYLWKGELGSQNKILYIGKSVKLRSRLRQYLRSDDPKTRFLMARVQSVEWIVTENEMEALLLENTLIKKHQPPYNIRLKDDKKYPYLCLTLGEMFPRLVLTRRKFSREHAYFGPFSDVRAARSTMAMIHKIFPIRKRALSLPLKKPGKPCLNFHMGRCWAPCAGNVDPQDYRKMIDGIHDFLEGRSSEVEERLTSQMQEYAKQREFEKAARLRNILQDIEKTREEQKVEFPGGEADLDIIGVFSAGRDELMKMLNLDEISFDVGLTSEDATFAQIILLRIRNGKLISKRNYALSEGLPDNIDGEVHASEIIESFFRDYYLMFRDIPPEILISRNFSEMSAWQQSLGSIAGTPITIKDGSHDTERAGLVRMAVTNARLTLSERILSEKLRNRRLGLRQLQKFLDLKELPATIECYDISNISGKEAVGSGVMLKDGMPHKPGYRKYKIKTYDSANDPGMMNEVLNRRFSRIAAGQIAIPDLVVIDGGTTQLRAAIAARDTHGLRLPMIGLAKKQEEIYTEDGRILHFDKDSPGMTLLRLARDEAHRFGVAYHRNLRMKRNLKSLVDSVRGVGEKNRPVVMNILRKIDLAQYDQTSLAQHLRENSRLSIQVCEQIADQILYEGPKM
ncbi:MAG: excinuclease ABC subunit UvrC [Leptospiraceae bacterium]|nr:excinuclease ABC subunit UvrC [Leptospiraceae bacterium]